VHEIRQVRALGPTPEPLCDPQCPGYDAATGCYRDCQAVLQRFSSEGAPSPLEPLVAPLVFELKKLAVWKIPRIW
jgi:hypothetical protein